MAPSRPQIRAFLSSTFSDFLIDPALAADAPEREQRQRIVVEVLGREKLDELNDWVASQLQRVYAPVA